MWVFTTGGFVSAVEHRDNPELLMVRARDRQSLDSMLDAIELAGHAEGVEHETGEVTMAAPSDYPWRVVVPKSTFAVWAQHEILNGITYENFKDAADEERGDPYHKCLMGVWTAMLQLEDTQEHWYRARTFTGHGGVIDGGEEDWGWED